MKTFNSLTLLFSLFVLISIPSSHCRTFQLDDESLVEKTCKRTPFYNVCIESLKSYPRSSTSDLRGLAQIMVNVLKEKANDALNKIHDLQSARTVPKEGLEACSRKYNTILDVDIPAAFKSLQTEVGQNAVKVANNDAKEATNCELLSHATLTKENNAVHDVAMVTAAVASQLFTN